jgi:hypothetical protein
LSTCPNLPDQIASGATYPYPRQTADRPRCRLLGLFDTERAGRLGPLLLHVGELAQQAAVSRVSSTDVAIIGDAANEGVWLGHEPRPRGTAPDIARFADLLGSLMAVDCVHVIGRCQVSALAARLGASLWPAAGFLLEHNYDTTLRLQRAWQTGVPIVPLALHGAAVEWATSIQRALTGSPFVALHLKGATAVGGQSAADTRAWYSFLKRAAEEDPAQFVLVGDERPDPGIASLGNVVCAADWAGACMAGYLALIQDADVFMGMMSGPSNCAILGVKPYTIFKNPDHHGAQMMEEIGASDQYPFAASGQRVLRQRETPELLWCEFNRHAAGIRNREMAL